MPDTPRYVGVDMAKAEMVVAARPGDERWAVANDEGGIRALVERLTRAAPALVVLEATGQLAKTDRIDARGLALFAERVRPEVRAVPDEAQQELDALLTRRRQLLEMLTAERNRLGQSAGRGRRPVKKSLKAHIEYLEREVRIADTELGDMIRQGPAWRERDDLLRSAPGVGRVLAMTLLADLPETAGTRKSLTDSPRRLRCQAVPSQGGPSWSRAPGGSR